MYSHHTISLFKRDPKCFCIFLHNVEYVVMFDDDNNSRYLLIPNVNAFESNSKCDEFDYAYQRFYVDFNCLLV
ncbi:hypothetical protein VNO77_16331 [Canavalia gladiata]|uniref:Uncharacterized protein n=1 Tax=Canavalia gladiata TaxID=3824 RepID=A0AAN9M0U1_CANGL